MKKFLDFLMELSVISRVLTYYYTHTLSLSLSLKKKKKTVAEAVPLVMCTI